MRLSDGLPPGAAGSGGSSGGRSEVTVSGSLDASRRPRIGVGARASGIADGAGLTGVVPLLPSVGTGKANVTAG